MRWYGVPLPLGDRTGPRMLRKHEDFAKFTPRLSHHWKATTNPGDRCPSHCWASQRHPASMTRYARYGDGIKTLKSSHILRFATSAADVALGHSQLNLGWHHGMDFSDRFGFEPKSH